MRKNTKKEYVLNQPSETSAEQVVKKAEEEGIKLTKAYVYNIRSAGKSKAKAKAKPKSAKKADKVAVRIAPLAKVNREVAIDKSEWKVSSLPASDSRSKDLLVQAIDALIVERVRVVLLSLAVNPQ